MGAHWTHRNLAHKGCDTKLQSESVLAAAKYPKKYLHLVLITRLFTFWPIRIIERLVQSESGGHKSRSL